MFIKNSSYYHPTNIISIAANVFESCMNSKFENILIFIITYLVSLKMAAVMKLFKLFTFFLPGFVN